MVVVIGVSYFPTEDLRAGITRVESAGVDICDIEKRPTAQAETELDSHRCAAIVRYQTQIGSDADVPNPITGLNAAGTDVKSGCGKCSRYEGAQYRSETKDFHVH